MSESYFQETANAPETPLDLTLRPPGFEDFHGQEKVTERLMLMVEAAKKRADVLEHILLSGPPGLGKTTLANIVSTAVGSTLHTTSGPQIEKAGDLAGMENCPALVVLAAGMGSRYGGLKQMDPMGPNGETVLDYSVFDAIRAGFSKVIFVIREDFAEAFRKDVGDKFTS
ncbi:AAA family ATPase, partial [Akkermansiaceae bacterium]|nr:AAA family ATPase [Akkermansiaceae bacterium]